MIFLDILFYAFVVVVLIQVFYYLIIFSRFAFVKPLNTTPGDQGISVIVCAKNEAENLERFLPLILEQDYPNFEVVLINDASYDDTLEVIEAFAEKDSRVKIVNVKNTEAFWANKKYALTLGIKAAKNEQLLLTDADCKPVSKHWISEMYAHSKEGKSIILGYGAHIPVKNSLLNKLIRFETLLTAIQYFSYAKSGIPYMGVGRNLAYTKDDFFSVNGFINHIQVRSGDDDLFINEVANKNNTAICFSPNSFTLTPAKSSFKSWFRQKKRHISTASLYKSKHKTLLGLFYLSQFLFWTLSILLLGLTFQWEIVIGLIVLRFLLQYLVFGKSAKKLHETDLLCLLPLLECFLIVMQLTIFISNRIAKPNHWK